MERNKKKFSKVTLFGLTTSMLFTSAGLGAFFIPQSFQSEIISFAETGSTYTVNDVANLQSTIDNAEAGDTIKLAGITLTGNNFKITKSITIEGTLNGEDISTICENDSSDKPFFGVVGDSLEVHFKNIKFTRVSGDNVTAISKSVSGDATVATNCNIYINNCISTGIAHLVDADDNEVIVSDSKITGVQGKNILLGSHYQLQDNTFEVNNSSYIDSTPILSAGNKFIAVDEIDEGNLSTFLSTLSENDTFEVKEDQDFEISLIDADYECKLEINGYLTVSGSLTNHTISSDVEIGDNGDLFILGGKYSNDISDYVVVGHIAVEDENIWTVYESNKITYYRNATDDDTENFCREYAKNSELKIVDNLMSYSKSGYYFGGWNTSKDGCGTHYDSDDEELISEDITLYAQWVHINHKDTVNQKEFSKVISNNLPTIEIGDVTYFALDSGNYYLKENVDLEHNIVVPANATVSICLNKYILKGNGVQSTITIQENGILNLFDCGSTNSGKITRANNFTGNGGGIYNDGTFTMYGGSISGISLTGNGAGVYNNGTFTMYGGKISDNNATTGSGGAIYNNGTVEITGGKIINDRANLGSAVYNTGTLTISDDVTIADNSANDGTIYLYGSNNTALIRNVEIKNNTANKNGGAICVKDTVNVNLDNVTLKSNIAYVNGGAICVFSGGGINIENSTIEANTTYKIGGGIYNSGKIDLYNTTIKSNIAETAGGVYSGEGSFNYISGKIVVDENTDNTEAKNNLYLDSNVKLIIKEGSPLTVGSLISLNLPTLDNRDLTYPSENNSVSYFKTDFDSDLTLLKNIESSNKNILKLVTFSNIQINTNAQSIDYDGSVKEYVISGTHSSLSGFDIKYYQNGAEVEPINAGSYDVVISREEIDNYFAYNKTIENGLVINKIVVVKPEADTTDFTYNYLDQTYNLATSSFYKISGFTTRNAAGSQNITVSLRDKNNTQWEDESIDDLIYVFTIKKLSIEKPEKDNTNFNYRPGTTKYTYYIPENSAYRVSGNEQTTGGNHEVRIQLKNKTNLQWNDETTDDIVYDFVINKCNLSIPSADKNTFEYNGYEQTYILSTSPYYTIVGNKQTNAGIYTVKVSINEPENYMWKDKDSEELTYTFVIKQIEITKPSKDENDYTYDGTEKVYSVVENDAYRIYNNKQTNAGQYLVTISLKDKVNYKWVDGDSNNIIYLFTIKRVKVQLPVVDYSKKYVYNGTHQTFAIEEKDYFTVSNGIRLNAGTQTVYVSLINQNYMWVDGTRNILEYDFVIEQKEVDEPTLKNSTFTFNGKYQVPELNGFESFMVISRGGTGYNAAEYEMNIVLSSNYKWSNNSDGKLVWRIEQKDITNAVVTLGNTLVYNGANQIQKIKSVVVDGLNVTYNISENSAKEVGSHVLKITGCGNFTGTIYKEYTIKRSLIDSQKNEIFLEIPNGLDDDVVADIDSDESIDEIYSTNPNKNTIISNIMNKMVKDEYIVKVYDIKLTKNGEEYNNIQTVKINILIHNNYNIGNLRVLKVHNGAVEEVKYTVKNNYIVVQVNELSEFVLVTKEETIEKMDLTTIMIIGLTCILFLSEIILLIYLIKDKKRRKYEDKLEREMQSIKSEEDIFVKDDQEIEDDKNTSKKEEIDGDINNFDMENQKIYSYEELLKERNKQEDDDKV